MIVTRDEAGMVRVEGAASEADAIKGATEMIDHIFFTGGRRRINVGSARV